MVVLGAHTRQGEAVLNPSQLPGTKEASGASPAPEQAASAWGSISIAILASRVLGLVREMVLARKFGAGLQTDAFNVAYRIPNLLRDLFAEGALSSAFVPTFVRQMTNHGKPAAWRLANRVLSALLVILGALTLIFFFGARGFVYLLASGYTAIPEKMDMTVQMTRIMSPFLLCISFASVGMGLLNACGSFFVPAMASSAFNICCILAGIFLSPFMPQWGLEPIVSMAIGALAGGMSQFLVMVPSAYRGGYRFRFDLDLSDPDIRRMARLMLPAVIGLSAAQINIMVDSQIASIYGNGPVSWLNYGFRLMQFPIGVFGIAVATVTAAAVSHYAARREFAQLHLTIYRSLKLAACLTFPATVGLIAFRYPIVQLLYEGGKFVHFHTQQTGQVVMLYAIGLFSYSAVKIIVPAFYAMEDARTPVQMSLISVAAKIALNFALVIPLGYRGLALATSVSSWLNFSLLLRSLKGATGAREFRSETGGFVRIAMASCAMGVISWIVFRATASLFPDAVSAGHSFALGAAIIIGVISIFPLFHLFRVEEGKDILRIVSAWMK
jgi:putative peptidoglycan lipid II flippase